MSKIYFLGRPNLVNCLYSKVKPRSLIYNIHLAENLNSRKQSSIKAKTLATGTQNGRVSIRQSIPCRKRKNLKRNSGDGSHSLGGLALVVSSAVSGHYALLGGFVDSGSKYVVSGYSGLLVVTRYSLSNLLAKGANAGHDGTVDCRAGNRLADALLSGLSVCHK